MTIFAIILTNVKTIKNTNESSPHITTIQVSPHDITIQVSLPILRCHRINVLLHRISFDSTIKVKQFKQQQL